jgi:SAM-dependent methyltransferase
MEAAHYEQTELWGDDHVFDPQHQLPKFEAVHELLPSPWPASICDVGAGDGRVLRYLADAGVTSTMVAAERSRAALRACPDRYDIVKVQASIDRLPLADGSAGVAVCCEVLEHLPAPVFERARSELARVAADCVIVTVPNREKRGRSDITCGECGCRYNPDRHLRSFAPDQLEGLLDGFRVERVIETGPRQPVYPRWARVTLERAGLLQRPGSPTCPQCGATYPHAAPPGAAAGRAGAGNGSGPGIGRRGYDVARRWVPKARHPYYLCARYRRAG